MNNEMIKLQIFVSDRSTTCVFVKIFVGLQAESAIAALNCSGVILGSLPIRVSPSKTPVRPRAPRSAVLH
nr:polyadenylate-binding protein-interacting protein 11-like [Ipomoea batatas]